MNTLEITERAGAKARVTSVCCDTAITHDVSEEFVLPDYVNEVRRVLMTRAQVLPESKYIADSQNGTSLDFGGTVTYFVIYTDDEGKLCSTPLSSNYEASTILKSTPSEVLIDTSPDSVTTRVSAPRRLTIKTRLKSKIFGYEEKEICESILQRSSADELFIERLYEENCSLSASTASLQGIKISDKFDTGSLSSLRPVLCDAQAILKDVKPSNGSVSCHGEATVKCICESDGELITLSKVLPIYEEVGLDDVCPSDTVKATARCVSLSISSEEHENGSELFFDMSCEIDCEAIRNSDITLTKDCYSTKNAMETKHRELELYSLVRGGNASFSLNESVKRKSKDKLEIIDTILEPVFEKCDFKGERACFIGRLCTSIIAKGEGESGEYLCESYDVPFKYELELARQVQGPIVRGNFSASLVNAKYSDDKLLLNAEIYPSVMVLEKSTTTILDTATLKKDTEFKKDASCVRVFFPNDGDVLWEIAKKYHTTRDKIMEQNSLDSDSLEGVKSIII